MKGARGTKGHFRDGVRSQTGRPERPKLTTDQLGSVNRAELILRVSLVPSRPGRFRM